MSSNHVKQLFKFIENSPSCFNAIKTITEELKNMIHMHVHQLGR